jgi:hypothetical protein
MKIYYILSLKHSPIGNHAVWWRPESAGYTTRLEEAGVFDETEIDVQPEYYNNGESTRAIECSSALGNAHHSVEWTTAKQLAPRGEKLP